MKSPTTTRTSMISKRRKSKYSEKEVHRSSSTWKYVLQLSCSFLLGCILSATLVINLQMNKMMGSLSHSIGNASISIEEFKRRSRQVVSLSSDAESEITVTSLESQKQKQQQQPQREAKEETILSHSQILRGLRIIVAIAAYDFSQIPHLEETIQSYHDLCVAGTQRVDIFVHATVAYPVTLIDLWNTRYNCENFSLTIVLKPWTLRLFLVDCHRKLFYDHIDEYDLFIYTEDDIRVNPSVVATYMMETKRVEQLLKSSNMSETYKPADFNVGIVRYEYNFPANVVIDDKTRHVTQNVSRVYWEHSYARPVIPELIYPVPQQPLSQQYITMKNHHQGMFLATRDLLLAWRDRHRCRFHEARRRPGIGSQPTEGTQRVWMSSQMLYGSRHCNVQQVIPKAKFGALTVLHLPNKNYRRVGKYKNRTFADGTEYFEKPHESLLTAMELHLSIRMGFPQIPQIPYQGIKMIDEVNRDRTPVLQRRLDEYEKYVQRGGILTKYDGTKVELVEER